MTYPDPPDAIAEKASLRELVDELEDALTRRGFQRHRGLGWGVIKDERQLTEIVAGWERDTEAAAAESTMNGVTLFLDGRVLLGLDRDFSVVLYTRPPTLRRPGSDPNVFAEAVGGLIDRVDITSDTIVLPQRD